jgi:hypothetical protein
MDTQDTINPISMESDDEISEIMCVARASNTLTISEESEESQESQESDDSLVSSHELNIQEVIEINPTDTCIIHGNLNTQDECKSENSNIYDFSKSGETRKSIINMSWNGIHLYRNTTYVQVNKSRENETVDETVDGTVDEMTKAANDSDIISAQSTKASVIEEQSSNVQSNTIPVAKFIDISLEDEFHQTSNMNQTSSEFISKDKVPSSDGSRSIYSVCMDYAITSCIYIACLPCYICTCSS